MIRLSSILLFLSLCISAAEPVKLPPRSNFHLFLLVGQSNMAGRGIVEDQDKTPHARVLMLSKSGEWSPATDPMHFDKPVAGTGLGKTFGALMAEEDPKITIGLIPCAVGGSPIDTWQPGVFYEPTKSYPWDDAVRRARTALKAGVLKGILWHQGESDSTEKLAPLYESKLHDLIARFRKALNAPDVPFVAGQMGRFAGAPWSEWKEMVDRAHRNLPAKVNKTAFVSSEGLEDKGDKVHFNAASYREFGRRYAAAYRKIRDQVRQSELKSAHQSVARVGLIPHEAPPSPPKNTPAEYGLDRYLIEQRHVVTGRVVSFSPVSRTPRSSSAAVARPRSPSGP